MTVTLRRFTPEEWAEQPQGRKPQKLSAAALERKREGQRRYAKANPEKVNAYGRRLQTEDPEMFRLACNARMAVHRAVKRGTLVRPDLCSQCNQPSRRIEASHHDYTRPLDVRWLCSSCHGLEDHARPKTHREAVA